MTLTNRLFRDRGIMILNPIPARPWPNIPSALPNRGLITICIKEVGLRSVQDCPLVSWITKRTGLSPSRLDHEENGFIP